MCWPPNLGVDGPLPYILSPTSEETDPCHDPESIAVGGDVSDSAAVRNVFTLALDSDRVDESVRSWYEDGGDVESLPNSDTLRSVEDEVRGCEEDVFSEPAGGVAGLDRELSFLDIDEERSG